MKPLIVLIISFLVALLCTRVMTGDWMAAVAGNAAMAVMLLFTAIGHFAYSKGMVMMMPAFMPIKKALVWLTGFIEIFAAVGLLIPSLRELTSWLLILFFILILPVNIQAAIKNVDYQKATYTGSGLKYLWFRIPLQILFVGWVWYFGIYLS